MTSNIRIIIGTKAQLVKMAPVMMELKRRKIDYTFIFTGQHKETIRELIYGFGLKRPDFVLYNGKDITKISQGPWWLVRCLWETYKKRQEIFGGKAGIVLVHGDAFSVLVGEVIAKAFGQEVGLIEAGLRSFDPFNPFPEEITRRLASRLADYHFCPGEFAYRNSLSYGGEKLNTQENTLLDTLRLALKNARKVQVSIPKGNYCVASIHRFENIFSKSRFKFIISALNKISKKIKVVFILHKPTREKLEQYHWLKALKENPRFEFRQRTDYFHFIKLIQGSEFLITDGGSNQEECFYLGKPCLIMRRTTERKEGLTANAVISELNQNTIEDFVEHYSNYQNKLLSSSFNPSGIIVNYLLSLK